MAFRIRSTDGRLTICTACADAAAEHATRLKQSGPEPEVIDLNGERYGVASLHQRAHALRAFRAPLLR